MTDAADMPDEGQMDDFQPKTGESKAWLDMVSEAQKVFRTYQEKADGIDKLYADLSRLASVTRDREYQVFWANIEVMKPSIYSRAPVPVVTPKFSDRRPLYQTASEFMERSVHVAFDMTDINSSMLLMRDDLAIIARGCPWVRYETKAESDGPTEKVCIEHVDRKDFLHEPARNWSEVGWVARRAWMTTDEMKDRFSKDSGDAYLQANTEVQRKDNQRGGATKQEKAGVWELWSKTENKVVWVCEGVDTCLDEGEPHLKLESFFPCPRPAYGTLQRGGMIPVPDLFFYKDQLEEINALTNRIHALSDSIKIKGFYPGGGEIGDAVEAALNLNDDGKIMVPVANWAAFGGGDPKIIWLPIDTIAETVSGLVELRQSIIGDVYQVSGLSDIQRGETNPNETLGAQQLKQMNGSVRIRDKQSEMVRVARDLVRITAEIMAENFDQDTLLSMSQMDLPSDADIKKQLAPLEKQTADMTKALQKMQADPKTAQMAQQNPDQGKQMLQQVQQQMQGLQGQIGKLQQTVTIDQVMKFLKDQKMRPFVLDIETDSTIAADEQAEKQSRTEFVTALGTLITQFGPVLQQQPEFAPMFGELVKFTLAPYRAGRELEGKIDEAIEAMTAKMSQPAPADPQAQAAQVQGQMDQQKHQSEMESKQADAQMKAQQAQQDQQLKQAAAEHDAQLRQRESDEKVRAIQVDSAQKTQKHEQDLQLGALAIQKTHAEVQRLGGQTQLDAQKGDLHVQNELLKQRKTQIETEKAMQPDVTVVASNGLDKGTGK